MSYIDSFKAEFSQASNQELQSFMDSYLRSHLTEKRYKHVLGVISMAEELSRIYCPRLVEKAVLCAKFHDMVRCLKVDQLDLLILHYGLPDKYLSNPNLAHSKVAAAIMKEELKIEDEDMLNAVSYHTTGRENMSMLEKIVYLADSIEEGRSYAKVEDLRELAFKNLDLGLVGVLTHTVEYLSQKQQNIDKDTLNALKFYEARGI